MQRIKFLLAAFLLVGCLGQATAQKAGKLEKKADKKVEQLNQQIMAGDETVALNEIQIDMIHKLYVGLFTELKNMDKSDKAAVKEARQAVNKTINKDILTKEQRKAKKVGKE